MPTIIEVAVRHMENNTSLKAYADKRAARLAGTFPKAESVKVVLDKQRHLYQAEFIVQEKGQTAVGATKVATNAASAIDAAAAHAEKQLRKQRNKVVSIHTRTTQKK
ncbi:MAG: HPF/RaiA family ribosome-associated protein [Kiritimatiellae bacterium]|nr:HPF/RaiA family ribosome-associated protein [Kiritimatiellia bacterium]